MIARAARTLDSHLRSSTYLVGHWPTLADVCLQASVWHVNQADQSILAPRKFQCLTRWFQTLESQHPVPPQSKIKSSAAKKPKQGEGTESGAKEVSKTKTKGKSGPKSTAKSAPDGARVDSPDTKGITAKKTGDFALWYTQVITRSEMIEYHDVSGCYILRPWSFFVWEQISDWLDARIKKLGVKNAYFPMFVSQEALEVEAAHVEGFAPEVAWVTRSGTSNLAKAIAIRPTSETIMYPAYAKWIRSHRDLPLKLNQWTNVVRWEFKQPTPFLRTREFLWQEGHTAHATHEEAARMVRDILDLYARLYEELLAVPVIKGVKSEEEKFAGGYMTTTVEAFVPANGRGIQAATSHHLGNNFAKMFGISFQDAEGQDQLVEQTSWGLSTRSIGTMIMIHSDDKGLVLPPRVASVQVVIIPIQIGEHAQARQAIDSKCNELASQLSAAAVRVEVDDRTNYKAGWKYNHWEMKGVPLRLEVGPQDMEKGTCRIVRRHNGAKRDISQESAAAEVVAELDAIHESMLQRATSDRDEGIVRVTEWSGVMPALNRRKLVLAPWCETAESEEAIKKATKELSAEVVTEPLEDGAGAPALSGAMKSLCIPLDQDPLEPGTKCFFTGQPAKRWCIFGRSY